MVPLMAQSALPSWLDDLLGAQIALRASLRHIAALPPGTCPAADQVLDDTNASLRRLAGAYHRCFVACPLCSCALSASWDPTGTIEVQCGRCAYVRPPMSIVIDDHVYYTDLCLLGPAARP